MKQNNIKDRLSYIVRTIINNGTLIPEETYIEELTTLIDKVREEGYQEGYDAKMKLELNYEMFNFLTTMTLFHGDMFLKWWEKEGCEQYLKSIKEEK